MQRYQIPQSSIIHLEHINVGYSGGYDKYNALGVLQAKPLSFGTRGTRNLKHSGQSVRRQTGHGSQDSQIISLAYSRLLWPRIVRTISRALEISSASSSIICYQSLTDIEQLHLSYSSLRGWTPTRRIAGDSRILRCCEIFKRSRLIVVNRSWPSVVAVPIRLRP